MLNTRIEDVIRRWLQPAALTAISVGIFIVTGGGCPGYIRTAPMAPVYSARAAADHADAHCAGNPDVAAAAARARQAADDAQAALAEEQRLQKAYFDAGNDVNIAAKMGNAAAEDAARARDDAAQQAWLNASG